MHTTMVGGRSGGLQRVGAGGACGSAGSAADRLRKFANHGSRFRRIAAGDTASGNHAGTDTCAAGAASVSAATGFIATPVA